MVISARRPLASVRSFFFLFYSLFIWLFWCFSLFHWSRGMALLATLYVIVHWVSFLSLIYCTYRTEERAQRDEGYTYPERFLRPFQLIIVPRRLFR